MTETIIPSRASLGNRSQAALLVETARKAVFSLLQKLEVGKITLHEKGRDHIFGEKPDDPTMEVFVSVHDPQFYAKVLLGGSVGAGEAYMAGLWSADNPAHLVQIMSANQSLRDGVDQGWMKLYRPLHRLFHLLRRNTHRGSRSNISAHYDLGNDFYKLFLDDTMTYSCAVFEREDSTLEQAQTAKYERICKKLQLTAGDHLLEIGTGWGGFAVYAASKTGCRVTTTTISDEQFTFAQKRVAEAGLSQRVTLLRKDYRQLKGQFDKLVSIEMIEAVGHHYFDTFFQACDRLLKPDGMMLLQAITIADHVFHRHKNSVDFIKRYIFPGSCIPSVAAMSRSMARKTQLRIFHLEDITPHYARTLRMWRQRFFDNIEGVRALGFDDVFIRMWDFYLSYCEGGFMARYIGDVQMLLTKPMCRRDAIVPRIEA